MIVDLNQAIQYLTNAKVLIHIGFFLGIGIGVSNIMFTIIGYIFVALGSRRHVDNESSRD